LFVILQKTNAENDLLASVATRLMSTPGVISYWVVPNAYKQEIMRLETEANRQLGLPGMRIVNNGIKDVLERDYVIMILHSPDLRHAPEPIIVICDEEQRVVGREVWERSEVERLSKDPNSIFLGKNLVLLHDALTQAKGKTLTFVYKALRFPELDEIHGIQNVISVTLTFQVHSLLSRKAGWDADDPNLGTVLIGFNKCA